MKNIKIIRDTDIGSDTPAPETFLIRRASRAVVFNAENKVAIVWASKNNYHKLPGGGVEGEEDVETALRRELIEEVGCEVGEIQELGQVEEYRNEGGLHQVSYVFTAHLSGEVGVPKLEPKEVVEGYVTKWLDLDEAIQALQDDPDDRRYDGKFMHIRDLAILKETKNLALWPR